MRAGSLSEDRVLALLSTSFVPVMLSVDSYDGKQHDKATKQEYERIRQEARTRKLSHGAVCVYLLRPNGELFASLDVTKASRPNELLPLLQRCVTELNTRPREAAAVRASAAPRASPPRARAKDGLILQITTRNVPEEGRGIAQDWMELTASEWAGLVPPRNVQVGEQWNVPGEVCRKIYPYLFPRKGSYDPGRSKPLAVSLTATVAAIQGDRVRLELHGALTMQRPYGRSASTVRATLAGVATYDRGKWSLTSLQLVSQQGEYVWTWEGKPIHDRFVFAIELSP
jgi:hypothetical protein